jgi:hypothetical protein
VGSVFPAPQLLTATSALPCKTSLLNLLQGGWEQIFVLQLSSLQSLFGCAFLDDWSELVMVVDGAVGPLFFERIGGPQQLLSTGYPPRLLDDDHSSGVSQVTVFFFFFFCFTLWGTSAATFPADFPAHNLQSLSFLPPSQSPFLFSFLPDLKSNGLSYVCPLLQKLILE